MLVLTRKLNEQIQIGNDITITVVRVKGNTVRVGIEAPRDVRIVRAELPSNADDQPRSQAADCDGAPAQPDAPVSNRSTEAADDEHRQGPHSARRTNLPKGTSGQGVAGPLGQLMQRQAARQSSPKAATATDHVAPRANDPLGASDADEMLAALRLKPRHRVPGEKPAVLPRLPRLGPVSLSHNRVAAYGQVATLVK